MSHARKAPSTLALFATATASFAAAPAGWRKVWMIVLAGLGPMAGDASGEPLGTYAHRHGTVQLMTELCRGDALSPGQQALQISGGRERRGCWGVDGAGNPVVTWSDGSELVLDGRKVMLARQTTVPPHQRVEPEVPSPLVEAPPPTTGQTAQASRDNTPEPASPRLAAGPESARPAWCPDARFAHERLVCSDPELAERDLHLASLWAPFRRTLNPAAVAWHKHDYFRRLKVCGADKACIISEQQSQMSLYRERLQGGSEREPWPP